MGLPKMGYPLRLLRAAAASCTSLNTTKACPRILSLRFTITCCTCPKDWNSVNRLYFRSELPQSYPWL